MKKKILQNVLSVLLCSAMMVSLVACGNTEGGKESKESNTEVSAEKNDGQAGESESQGGESESQSGESGWTEITELTVYYDGVASQKNPVAEDYIAEQTGVKLNVRANGDGVLQSMIATGGLKDIVMMQNPEDIKVAIEAGLLLDLTQYKDQLPNYFNNEEFEPVIKHDSYMYGDEEKLYTLAEGIGKREGLNSNLWLRWDVYESLGYPEVNTIDEFLGVLKQMQDSYPETDKGEKVYALGIFTDWDGAQLAQANTLVQNMLGYINVGDVAYMKADMSGELQYVFDDNSPYYQALQFLYKANQMGILDPDSPTMVYSEFDARMARGRYLVTYWNWWPMDPENGIGYKPFLPEAFTKVTRADEPFSEHSWRFCVNAKTENLDAVLRYINWAYDPQTIEVTRNGFEGVKYEYNDDGIRVMTEEYKSAREAGKSFNASGTPKWTIMAGLSTILSDWTLLPGTDIPVSIDAQYPILGQNTLDKMWYDVYGEISLEQYAESSDQNIIKKDPAWGCLDPLPQDLNELNSSFASIMNTASWKMVFAKDEAEFEKLWDQLQKDAADMNIEQIYEWQKENVANAKELYEKFTK